MRHLLLVESLCSVGLTRFSTSRQRFSQPSHAEENPGTAALFTFLASKHSCHCIPSGSTGAFQGYRATICRFLRKLTKKLLLSLCPTPDEIRER
eukprot:s6712_g4.t1